MHFITRPNRLAVLSAATIITSCVVAAVSRGDDPAPATQNSAQNSDPNSAGENSGPRPRAEMPPEWAPPPADMDGERPRHDREHDGPPRDGHHGGPDGPPGEHGPRPGMGGPPPGGFGGPDGAERDRMTERGVRNGIGMGIVPQFGRFGGFLPAMDEEVTEDEWQKTVELMSQYSPTRLALFNKIQGERGEKSPIVRELKRRMVGFMRMLERAKKTSPRTNDFALHQMKIEDDIISLLGELREGDSPEKQEKLNAAVKAFIENNLNEREAWLTMIEATIAKEREALQRDREKIDERVDSRAKSFREDYEEMIERMERGPERGRDRDEHDRRPHRGPPPDDRDQEGPAPATQPGD